VDKVLSSATTHIKIKMFPDGGIARLCVYGIVVPRLLSYLKSNDVLDLALVTNGGLVIAASDSHFGPKANVISPWIGRSMTDGWETKRTRVRPNSEWIIIQLGHNGFLKLIEIDTRHFKGNYPDSITIHGSYSSKDGTKEDAPLNHNWKEIAVNQPLGPHQRHFFTDLKNTGPFTHIKLTIVPDGGVSRCRVYGHLRDPRQTAEEDLSFLLCAAAARNDFDTIKSLLAEGINFNLSDYDQRTALHLAASEGHLEMVKFLLANGAKILRDRWGNTAIEDSSRKGFSEITEHLKGITNFT